MSKVGFIVECGPNGLEVKVVTKICELIAASRRIAITPQFTTMTNKKGLIEGSGKSAKSLLAGGCVRVVVLWDERPTWPDKAQPLCWYDERTRILASLEEEKVPLDRVGLVAIEREFESWLLFDNVMLSAVLSRPTWKAKVPPQGNPDRIKNPKGKMISLFEGAGRGRYNDLQHADLFVKHLTTLSRIRGCKTFVRFENKVRGI